MGVSAESAVRASKSSRRVHSSVDASRDDAPGFGARHLAAATVAAVLKRKTPLDETFAQFAESLRLEPRDEALARAIVTASFRRLGTIRATLLTVLAKGMPKDETVASILISGAAQIFFLDIPKHSAVDLAVRLAKSSPKTVHAAGLINAVLRKIVLNEAEVDPFADIPDWLSSRWIGWYGPETAKRIALALRQPATIDLSLKTPTNGAAVRWAERFGASILPTGSLRLTTKTPVRDLPGYDEGDWWVQDAAASLPVKLLQPQLGERIADLCAAPGGKTAQIAALGAHVVALDRSVDRLRLLKDNMARLKLSVEALAGDLLGFDAPPFDAVLLDAPCSATGTLRRHPEGAWIKTTATVERFAQVQRKYLDKAATLVKPGGRLVYCTCSLEPEEGEEQADAFLMRHPNFSRVPISAADIGLEEVVTERGDLRTLPCHLAEWRGRNEAGTGLDGFFAARFTRAVSD